jgi:hypothetical protein
MEAIMRSRLGNQKGFSRSSGRGLWHSLSLRVEELESRFLFSAGGLDNIFAAPDRGPGGGVTNPNPVGYDPAQIRHAYGFDQITFSNGTVKGDGRGQTIAIVDAYDDPNIFKDLDVFDSTFGLQGPASSFLTKVTPQGHTKTNASWAGEISLDVEWAHAIAPGAKILLVEARNSSLSNLLSAVSYANSQPGVVAVSMSWGGGEFSSETLYDSYFTAPGITYAAASGDSPGVIWPSSSPNVLSVGGTSLTLDSNNNISSETGWSSSGGGTSSYESLPSYQRGVTNTSTRANPDVAFDADPNTGVAVYDTVAYFGQTGWFQVGGTSLGAPAWAALVAIADQGRGAGGSLSSAQTLTTLYANPGDFHYIASSAANTTAAGYNLVTGLGTPIAQQIVKSLVTAPALKPAAAQTTTSAADKTPASNGTRSATTADTMNSTQAVAFFLFLSSQPQITYGPTTPTNPAPVALPAALAAVFVPPSFTAVGSTSRGGGSSASTYARGGMGPVLPGPEDQQPPDSSAGQTGSRVKPEKAPGDSRPLPPASPQNDKAPQVPDNKKDDSVPDSGFWEVRWAVDGATLVTNDNLFAESASESAALLPGLVALLGGSWGASMIDPDVKSEIPNPKSENKRTDS